MDSETSCKLHQIYTKYIEEELLLFTIGQQAEVTQQQKVQKEAIDKYATASNELILDYLTKRKNMQTILSNTMKEVSDEATEI